MATSGIVEVAAATKTTLKGLASELRMQSNIIRDHNGRLENILTEAGIGNKPTDTKVPQPDAPEDPSLAGTLREARAMFRTELNRYEVLIDRVNTEMNST